MTDQIAPEVAAKEFDRFVELWDIDDDLTSMDEGVEDDFNAHRRRFTRAVRRGRLTVNDDATLDLRLLGGTACGVAELKVHMPRGSDLMEMDRLPREQSVARMNTFLGAITRQTPQLYSGDTFDGRDLKVLQAVATLFLAL